MLDCAKNAIFVPLINMTPMKYLSLPDDKPRFLPFYLAAEEYVARHFGDEVFFTWVVPPTVICGRNQSIELEVDLDYCRAHGIEVYRRKSGGGSVFADGGNIMFSYVTSSDNVSMTYSRYTGAVVAMLRGLGLNASDTSRNDILVDGLKVSGNAFYHLPGRSIVHGTMLFDTDITHIARALTPSRAKLESKGIKSVESRVTMLKRYLPSMTVDVFRDYAVSHICDGILSLTDDDVRSIEEIALSYLEPSFRWGKKSAVASTTTTRIDGVGEISIDVEEKMGTINNVFLTGDFFLLGDLDGELLPRLRGVKRDSKTLEAALADIDVSTIIRNLSNNQFINLLTEDQQKNYG